MAVLTDSIKLFGPAAPIVSGGEQAQALFTAFRPSKPPRSMLSSEPSWSRGPGGAVPELGGARLAALTKAGCPVFIGKGPLEATLRLGDSADAGGPACSAIGAGATALPLGWTAAAGWAAGGGVTGDAVGWLRTFASNPEPGAATGPSTIPADVVNA